LVKDWILSKTAEPWKLDIPIGAKMVWKVLGTKQVASNSQFGR
jgi:hypothetical protein